MTTVTQKRWRVRIAFNVRHCGGWSSVTYYDLEGTRNEAKAQAQVDFAEFIAREYPQGVRKVKPPVAHAETMEPYVDIID